MTLKMNPRGNGACPLCSKSGHCLLQRKLTEAIAAIHPSEDMEIVIYSCGQFKEKS